MAAKVRGSTKAWADSVMTASHASLCEAAMSSAIAPPTLCPNSENRVMPSARCIAGKNVSASSRMKSKDGRPTRGVDLPKPSLS
jgi:hypothetical protein